MTAASQTLINKSNLLGGLPVWTSRRRNESTSSGVVFSPGFRRTGWWLWWWWWQRRWRQLRLWYYLSYLTLSSSNLFGCLQIAVVHAVVDVATVGVAEAAEATQLRSLSNRSTAMVHPVVAVEAVIMARPTIASR